MIERFDHAVIGIPDLEDGIAAFRRLGFEVSEGGRHPSLGTRNAIVRFGLDYLELLSVEDARTAQARGPFGSDLLSFLRESSGLVGFVLAGSRLEEHADAFRSLGIGAEGPFEMDRIRPDGRRLEWRLVVPGGSPWRKPWPYLIDWITPESDLLAWDPPGDHRCGVTGVAGMDLITEDLGAAREIYQTALGLRHRMTPPSPGETGTTSFYLQIGSFSLGLHQPTGDGAARRELDRRGPGPFRLLLSSPDLAYSAATLSTLDIPFSMTHQCLDIDRDASAGARIRIVPVQGQGATT
ncbi:MAG: VOC family protein [Acidimicrobiia bacterium]|nr:VOC family protein [bacterium]MXX46496.1 VOC family protein [Acidimicrobiia bacterium]MYJ15218.1 VOC family protein [Acidimicrobiia bacterium]